MLNFNYPKPIDYLVIGHVTCDVSPRGNVLGGTAAYGALTAAALGQRVGIVTALGTELGIEPIEHLQIAGLRSDHFTTFENIETPEGRRQIVHHLAPSLKPHHIPQIWLPAPVIHLGPLVNEIDLDMFHLFPPHAFVGATLQGWLREWDKNGNVTLSEWPEASYVLGKLDAGVMSISDVNFSQERVNEISAACNILVVTEGAKGARLYERGEVTFIPNPEVKRVDTVGAGDIFAAAFFIHTKYTGDAVEAVKVASYLASNSVTRTGLDSVPTPEEVRESQLLFTE